MSDPAADIAAADDTIAALRLTLVRLDLNGDGQDIRIGDGVIWSLCDLASGAFARAFLAESFLGDEERGAYDRTFIDLDEWRDHIRAEMTGLIETLTLSALAVRDMLGPMAPQLGLPMSGETGPAEQQS